MKITLKGILALLLAFIMIMVSPAAAFKIESSLNNGTNTLSNGCNTNYGIDCNDSCFSQGNESGFVETKIKREYKIQKRSYKNFNKSKKTQELVYPDLDHKAQVFNSNLELINAKLKRIQNMQNELENKQKNIQERIKSVENQLNGPDVSIENYNEHEELLNLYSKLNISSDIIKRDLNTLNDLKAQFLKSKRGYINLLDSLNQLRSGNKNALKKYNENIKVLNESRNFTKSTADDNGAVNNGTCKGSPIELDFLDENIEQVLDEPIVDNGTNNNKTCNNGTFKGSSIELDFLDENIEQVLDEPIVDNGTNNMSSEIDDQSEIDDMITYFQENGFIHLNDDVKITDKSMYKLVKGDIVQLFGDYKSGKTLYGQFKTFYLLFLDYIYNPQTSSFDFLCYDPQNENNVTLNEKEFGSNFNRVNSNNSGPIMGHVISIKDKSPYELIEQISLYKNQILEQIRVSQENLDKFDYYKNYMYYPFVGPAVSSVVTLAFAAFYKFTNTATSYISLATQTSGVYAGSKTLISGSIINVKAAAGTSYATETTSLLAVPADAAISSGAEAGTSSTTSSIFAFSPGSINVGAETVQSINVAAEAAEIETSASAVVSSSPAWITRAIIISLVVTLVLLIVIGVTIGVLERIYQNYDRKNQLLRDKYLRELNSKIVN